MLPRIYRFPAVVVTIFARFLPGYDIISIYLPHLRGTVIYDIITESEQLEKNGFDLNPALKMAIMRKVIIITGTK